MIGVYVNTGRGRRVTISPAVPGAQYRIMAWALGNGSRSATPAVESVTTGEASELIYKEEYILVHVTSLLLLHLNASSILQAPPNQGGLQSQDCPKTGLN